MWRNTLGRISRAILSDHPHDFATLPCMQFEPRRGLERGLPTPPTGTAYIMIEPDSGTLALHVFAEQPYHTTLSKMGDMVDSGFDFAEVTGKSLFLAVHRDGHFHQKIDTGIVMEEISDYALRHDCAFLLQIDAVDLDLSPLYTQISNRLQTIRTPLRVKGEEGYHSKDHPEKGGDLDRDGEEILASLRSGPCSSVVIWCFSDNPPVVGFTGSEASISWLRVDSDVIARKVTLGNKLVRMIKKAKHSKVADIFKSEAGMHSIIRFVIRKVVRGEIHRYLDKRKNSPVFFFDGDLRLYLRNVQSSRSVDSPNQTRSESLEDVEY